MSEIRVKDSISFKDNWSLSKSGLWARTEVIGGYGEVHENPFGKSTLDEVCFRQHNIVPIGGVSYVMEQMFGVKESQITIPTMYTNNGIGKKNSGVPTETYITPNGEKTVIYRYGHFVQLFGIGITGTAENDVTMYHPDYRENDITLSKVNSDGLTVTGTLLPFRFTQSALDSNERKQYFGKKTNEEGITGYYLKRFETEPTIKHIWKTGEDVDDEELISDADVWENMSGLNAVESFVEIYIKITKKDVKEWFISLEQEDRTRINTLALFNGQFVAGENAADNGDYRDVRLFSKLCINPEYLNLSKDLSILYRVYGA
jgi:hypothetical protein